LVWTVEVAYLSFGGYLDSKKEGREREKERERERCWLLLTNAIDVVEKLDVCGKIRREIFRTNHRLMYLNFEKRAMADNSTY
jgi:hypothetical protein